ncbi:hypothetical protein [Deinococcus ruber]|uniref:Uncharacterized protein n=1 Tax=Deinococcus ruber TaxID=1848197 RepID=A0A918CPD7_9DEIO|nr:hypothetical protein [Deinococcus ruber]GGR31462.1 hypothetical protein GCM10008957_47720 [Deinococcus ruber]
MFTIVNSDVTKAANIQTLGRKMYMYSKGAAGWTDFGVLESVTPARANTRLTLKGNRTGKTETFKDIADDDTLTFTAQTSATGDAAVRAYYIGSAAIVSPGTSAAFAGTNAYTLGQVVVAGGRYYQVTAAGTSAASAPTWPTTAGQTVTSGGVTFTDVGTTAPESILAYQDTTGVTEGGMIFVRESAEAGGLNIVRAYPHVQIQGNGEPDIQSFNGLEFLITVLSASGFTPPASFGDFGTNKPSGVVYQVPDSRLDALLTALGTAIKTFVDAS